MLIGSFFYPGKYTAAVHWQEHQRFKPCYPPSSRDGSQPQKAVLIKSPMWQGNVPFLDLRLSNDLIPSPRTCPLWENGSCSSAKISCNLVTFDDAFEQKCRARPEVAGLLMPFTIHKVLCGALGVTLYIGYDFKKLDHYGYIWFWCKRNVKLLTGNDVLDKGFGVKDTLKGDNKSAWPLYVKGVFV